MEAYLVDWLNLCLRSLHFIAGVAWIGASFYFVMLDNSLSAPSKADDRARGVHGELWAVHGGGFYLSQKFLTGPRGEALSENLHWSKWEAYTTWLSGMGLLALVYWYGANTYLIDTSVMALSRSSAIALSIAFIGGGWIVYDLSCRLLAKNERLLAGAILVLVFAATWALFKVFGARAAYVHVGALLGTIMVANVFFHIIPGQKAMVADIRGGRSPDPMPGIVGKQRSVHNTYFTLPVLFAMISNHYPMTYSNAYGSVVLLVIMLAGVLIRQFFVLRHKGRTLWMLPSVALLLLISLAVAMAPRRDAASSARVELSTVKSIIDARCVTCHAAVPKQDGFAQPPKGIVLESAEEIAQNAAKVAETVGNRYMPIGNLTQMTDDERGLIAAWFAQNASR